MNDRFWMYNDLNLLWPKVEQPAGFDQLETFVEHRGGIDSDLISHSPRWMVERVRQCRVANLFQWCMPERPATGRENNASHFVRPATGHRLENGGMLGIDGKNRDATFAGFGNQERTGYYKGFFVCQCERFSRTHGAEGCGQSCRTDNSSDNDIHFLMPGEIDHPAFAGKNPGAI